MEGATEILTNPVVSTEEPECMEISPLIDETDFMDAAATSLLADSTAHNPYADQMLKDGLTYADIDYFLKSYSNINNIKYAKVHCTCCNKHVGTAVETTERFAHPLLQVIVCENCYMFYCSGDFETDQDGSELYCRWCGEGGQVFCCSKCPYVFCKKCISRNLGKGMAPEIECMDDWLCFNCNPCQISKQRAVCWAITKYAQETKDLSEFSPNIKSQLFTDFSTCCKSKRALAKAGLLPAPKKQKTDLSSKLKLALEKEEMAAMELTPALVWENSAEPGDEVICTPDILPFEESPPSSPPPLYPMEYAPPPGQRGPDAPPNVPLVKRIVLPKPPAPVPKKQSAPPPKKQPVPKERASPAAAIIKTPLPRNIVNTAKNSPKSVGVTAVNVVQTTQKITVPVQKGNTNSDEQWFGTAVVRSAEVTEYISSKVSLLAFMNSSDDVTIEKREEIYRTFQSHLDIAIAKLKNIKQNMTSSYKRLLSKQAAGGNTIKIPPVIIKPTVTAAVVQPVVINAVPTTPASRPLNKPTRTSARKRSINYIESTSDEEEWQQSDSDEEYSSGSARKKYRKKKSTQKKTETSAYTPSELVKPVDISAIVNNSKPKLPIPVGDKIILDVIDLVDDSNDAMDNPMQNADENLKSLSDIEREEVPEIDSDISEILPDHLLDDDEIDSDTELSKKKELDNKKTTNKTETIEIDDDVCEDKTSNDEKSVEKEQKEDESKEKSESKKNVPMETEDDIEKGEKKTKREDEEIKREDKEIKREPEDKKKKGEDEPDGKKRRDKEKKREVEATKPKVEEINEDDNDENSNASLPSEKKSEKGVKNSNINESELSEDETMNDDSQSSLPKSKVEEKDKLGEKMECDDSDDNSNMENDTASENKNSEIENTDDVNTNTSVENTKSDNEKEKNNVQNGACSNDTSKEENDLSDNAVDNEIDKSNIQVASKAENQDHDDVENFLSSSVIKSKTVKDNFGDEFSKFVSNSKSSFSDEELEDELVGNMCEETDDALSLPPQNTLDFALGIKDDKKETKNKNNVDLKNGSEQNNPEEKSFLDTELNVLRKLAENCINSDVAANNPNVC